VTPWTETHQTPLHGILQARILEWAAIPFSRQRTLLIRALTDIVSKSLESGLYINLKSPAYNI